MPLLWTTEYYTAELLRKYSQYTFVFGDNIQRIGKGGQAIIRDEPNVIGIPTKATPGIFFVDYKMEPVLKEGHMSWNAFKKTIDEDLQKVEDKLALGETVVVPMDFIGTGLAALPEKAPGLLFYLYHRFNLMMLLYGVYHGELKNSLDSV